MDKKIELYLSLSKEFESRSFILYLVGGTVRDCLLDKELTDMDLVTDATPLEMKEFLPDADYTFSKYGSVKVKIGEVKFDITTLRKEEGYGDYRHPSKICFTKSIKEDVFRRDITINAMYMDKDLKVIDLVGGQKDLNNKIIRMIGNPRKRIEEDPLRIIRVFRFMLETGFSIDEELKTAIEEKIEMVNLLNRDKIIQEIKKSNHPDELKEILRSHRILIDY